jgi:hypothetical protein
MCEEMFFFVRKSEGEESIQILHQMKQLG